MTTKFPMSIFCRKKLTPAIRLGGRFRQERELHGLDIKTVAEFTHIQPKYLTAIEEGDFTKLPKAKAYRQAYLREYATFLGLDAAHVLEQFALEEGFDDTPQVHPHTTLKQFPFASVSVFARTLVLVGFVVAFGGYLAWQVKGVVEPPHLAVYSPLEGSISSDLFTIIQGETEKESQLTVNGQEIRPTESGIFETRIDLSPGVNTITVVATKKHGKTSTVVRHLVVKQRPGGEQISLK